MAEQTKPRTIKDWLEELALTTQSSGEDSMCMQNLLRRNGVFPRAVVIVGIVYLEGSGQPIDIHTCARMLLKAHQ